ncbi:hypothetical protein GPJ56_004016 [Histomonas meleagridis]|uniref:uncharacterized protein n=1 Tax=Histomonas meleagridis TaxID=135588 RepID=UPI00355A48A5|nr:hypothetical protein GPJ56_004016 [Histomonas meleagridis]KAH0804880.1 hypothetical protein GO595_002330 [Histomonas meleagridis]
MMEWYLEVLPEVFALEEKPKEYLDDSFLVQFYTKVVNSKENFLGEMKTVCLELIQAYLGSGYQRCAAVTIKKYSYLLENGQEYLAISLISLIKLNFPITQEITEEMLTKIPFDDRVKICCQILSSPNLKVSHKNAANQISKIFTDSKFTSKHVTSLPCIAHNEDNAQGYEVNKIVNIKLKLKCLFDSQIEVPYIEIGFIHMGDANDIVFFNTTNVKISDGSLLCVKGSFQKQGLYSPYCAKIGTEASHIYYTFPTLNPTIKVRTKPNVNALHSALYCHLVLPSVLLPAQWQTASLSIGVVKHLSSLQLFISGVTFKTAKLEDVNGTVYLPDDEFVFSELKPGTYLMDLPIMAYDSGTIDVSLQSGKDNIKYTKRYYVSDFLKMSVKYRKRTKVATLSAVGNSNLDINITNVIFYKGDDQISDCNIIGIPCKVSRNTTSAIFVLGSEPEYAHVWIEQDKLKPFLVKVNVELMEKEDLKNKNMIPQTPFTVVVPDDISSRLY